MIANTDQQQERYTWLVEVEFGELRMGKSILRIDESATGLGKVLSCLNPYEELGTLNFEFATLIIKEKGIANANASITLQRSCQNLTFIFENSDDK